MKKRILHSVMIMGLFASLLAGCKGWHFEMLGPNQDQVMKAANTIADFELPEGFSPEVAVHLMEYSIVSFKSESAIGHLYLIQASPETDGENMVASLDTMVQDIDPSQTDLALIESIPVNVRGTETNLVISEGTNGEGISYRQAMVVFQGKGGDAMVILSEPLTRWNQDAVEAFVQSIK